MGHGLDQKQAKQSAEKSAESKDRGEKSSEKAGVKSSQEADHEMPEHNKKIAKETEAKRKSRKSGVTDTFNENQKDGKKVASANDLLPLEDPNGKGTKGHKAGLDNTQAALIALAGGTVVDAAHQKLDDAIQAGKHAVVEMGKGMQEAVSVMASTAKETADYYGKAVTGKTNFGADVQEFGKAIGKTLGTAGHYYVKEIPGGKSDLGKDIGSAGKALANKFNSMNLGEKSHFFGKEVVPLLVPGAIGAIAKDAEIANLAGKGAEVLSGLGNIDAMAAMDQKIAELQQKVAKLQETLVKPPLKEAYETAGGRPLNFETPRANDGLLLKHGDKGLPDGIKPSDRLTPAISIDKATGEVVLKSKIPNEILKAAEQLGVKPETVAEKFEKINKALFDAYLTVRDYNPAIHGTPKQYGNLLHSELRKELDSIIDPLIHTEESYLKGSNEKWGKLGTSRVDIILGEKQHPIASLCLKTLKGSASAQQERGWVKNLPKLPDGSVPPRFQIKLPKPEE